MKNPFIYVEIIFFRSNFWWKLANRRNGWKSRKNKMRSIFQKKGSGECVTKKKRTIKTNCLKLLRSLLYPIDNCKSVRQQIKIGWISKPETYNSCSFASIHLQIAETPRFLQSHLLHYGIHSTATLFNYCSARFRIMI